MKAFVIHDGDEGWSVQFAEHGVVARRHGAAELDVDFGDVTCRREPGFDSFAATGIVPASARLAAGWWYECHGCGCRISADMGDYTADDETTDEEKTFEGVVIVDENPFCSEACWSDHTVDKLLNRAEEARWVDLLRQHLLRLCPLAEVHRTHAYARGARIVEVQVQASFPGSRWSGLELFIDRKHPLPELRCAYGDLAAWRAYRYERSLYS